MTGLRKILCYIGEKFFTLVSRVGNFNIKLNSHTHFINANIKAYKAINVAGKGKFNFEHFHSSTFFV